MLFGLRKEEICTDEHRCIESLKEKNSFNHFSLSLSTVSKEIGKVYFDYGLNNGDDNFVRNNLECFDALRFKLVRLKRRMREQSLRKHHRDHLFTRHRL